MLDFPRVICGIAIRPLRLIDYSVLSACGSPFFCGGPITNADIFAFLWRLSPEYEPRNSDARDAFTEKLGQATVEQLGEAGTEIADYLAGVFVDAPGGSSKDAPIGSFLASVIDCFAREYGWSAKEIEDTSLSRVYQLFRFIQRSGGVPVPLFNRASDKAKQEYAAAMGRIPGKRRDAWLQRQIAELRAEE